MKVVLTVASMLLYDINTLLFKYEININLYDAFAY